MLTLFLCSPCSRFRGLCFGPSCVSHLPSAPRHSHQDHSFASSSSRRCGGEGSSACQCSSELNPSSCRRPVCVFPPYQVLLFPALSFIQAGRLSSLEFVSRELSSQTHVWLQIYRPHCPYHGLRLLLPSKSIRQTRLAGQSLKVLTEIHRPAVATHAHTHARRQPVENCYWSTWRAWVKLRLKICQKRRRRKQLRPPPHWLRGDNTAKP